MQRIKGRLHIGNIVGNINNLMSSGLLMVDSN